MVLIKVVAPVYKSAPRHHRKDDCKRTKRANNDTPNKLSHGSPNLGCDVFKLHWRDPSLYKRYTPFIR